MIINFLKKLDLPTYIRLIAELPASEVIPTTEEEKIVLGLENKMWMGVSLYLREMLLGDKEISSALAEHFPNSRSNAQNVATAFKLIQVVHKESSNPVLKNFPSAAAFWFYWVCELAGHHLQCSGFATGQPTIYGKEEVYDATRNLRKSSERLIEDRNTVTDEELALVAEHPELLGTESLYYDRLLLFEAIRLSRCNPKIGIALENFFKERVSAARQQKHCPRLQHVYLQDGKIFLPGEKRKRSKKPRQM